MQLTNTSIAHGPDGWHVEFIGDDGDTVSVLVGDDHACDEDEALERAKSVMIELTAFGSRGGGRSLNTYDALSNGNLDDEERLAASHH
jgi:hypothetical protein